MPAIMVVDPATRNTVTQTESSASTVSSVTIAGASTTLGVSLTGINSENPLPVTLGGEGGSVAVTASTPLEVEVTNASLPVTFPSDMNVTVTNATIPISTSSPLSVTAATPMNVNISNASIPVTIAAPVEITSSTPLEVSFDAGGGMDVALTTLLAGEDQTNDWVKTADGATQGYHLLPMPTATGGLMPNETSIGAAAAAGDYLKSITLFVSNTTNAACYLSQDGQTAVTSGSTGSTASASTSVSVTATSAFTATANQYAGRILKLQYTPTGSASQLTIRRRIVSHAAFSAVTALTFVVTHAIPAGGTIGSWQVEGDASFELTRYNNPVGIVQIELGQVSTYGGWRIAVDSGVDAHVIGRFS